MKSQKDKQKVSNRERFEQGERQKQRNYRKSTGQPKTPSRKPSMSNRKK